MLLVEVPEDAIGFIIDYLYLICNPYESDKKVIELPQCQWEILGKSTELSEEQMKEICEFRFGNQSEYLEAGFIDYNTPVRNGFGDKYILNKETVQESYLSLLEANGIDNNKIHLVLKRI